MSSTLCWYFRFFSSSCSLKIVVVVFPWLHLELIYVTMTLKNAVTPRDQNPPALKSSLACRLVTVLLRLNHSLLRGCSCGSTSMLVQTLPISEVSRLRTPPCLCTTNPPFLQDKACQTVYFSLQTHLLGKSDGGILYLKHRESLSFCLFSTKPWSTIDQNVASADIWNMCLYAFILRAFYGHWFSRH